MLGVIGIILPLLPTTPFLLLSASCYAKSSDKLYQWLIENRWFGKYIKSIRRGEGIPLRVKITAISMLWLTIGFSVLFVIEMLLVRIVLIVIAVGVTWHIVSYRNVK